ncbi:MAG: hypothetical protein J0626_05565, partial [Rhodospirillaceae bacterium]|nr:hypothetical protein [Rhodospirillaceae bacterium]
MDHKQRRAPTLPPTALVLDERARALIAQAQSADAERNFAASAPLWAELTRHLPKSWIAFN